MSPGWTGSTREIRANLWNYNPDHVYDGTAFWVALTQDGTHYSQVGWAKDNLDQGANHPEYVFSQYRDGGNPVTRYYNASTGTWGTSKATSPSSSVTYQTNWIRNGDTKQAQNIYNGGTSQNLTVGFTPIYYEVDGEVLEYQTSSGGVDYGDHGVGDTTTHMKAEYIQYWSDAGSWTDGLSYTYVHTGPYGNDTNATGTGFDIWDTRCSN